MDNVLINIDFEVSGQSELINNLVKMGKLTAEEAATFKQAAAMKQQATSQQIGETNKLTSANEKGAKSIADLVAANKNLTSSLPTQAINQASKELITFGGEMNRSAETSKSLKAQLRSMKEELNLLEESGQENTARFEQLSISAAKLTDQLGDTQNRIRQMASDTKYLDAGLQVLGGVASAYSVAQGASALFGTDQKELQKTLVKLNAVMAIANGLQQIQTLTQKENIAVTLISTGQKRLAALATTLETAAESENIIVKGGATAAQWLLNYAQMASPVLLLVGGVVALTAALYVFTSGTKSASEAQTELNTAQLKALEISAEQDNLLKESSKAKLGYLEDELKVKQAAGESDAKQYELQKKIDEEKKATAKQIYEKNQADIGALSYLKWEAVNLDAKLNKLQSDNASEELIKQYETQKEFVKKRIEVAQSAKDEYFTILAETGANEAKYQEDQRRKTLESFKATADAKLLLQKANSKAELDAKIADLQAGAQLELDDVNLSGGQRFLIETKLQKEITEAKKQYVLKQLEDKKNGILAEQQLFRQNAEYQLQAGKDLAKSEYDLAINQKDITDNQRFLAEQIYLNKVADLQKKYDEDKAKSTLNAEMSQVNARLQAQVQFNGEFERLGKESIDIKMQMDINAAISTIHNEEELQAKILEIKAKANKDKEKIDKDYYKSNQDAQMAAYDYEVSLENIYLKQKEGTSAKVLQNELSVIAAKQQQNEQYYSMGLISEQEYQNKVYQLKLEAANKNGEIAQLEIAQSKQIYDAVLNAATTLTSEVTAYSKQITDNKLAELDKQRNHDLSNKDLTEAQKARIQKQYDDKARAIKQEAAKQEKAARIFEATMNTATAIVNALTAVPAGPQNFVLAALAGVMGAAQIAMIASQPIPQFEKGGTNIPAGMKLVGEKGPELIWTPGGETIYNHQNSMDIIKAFNNGNSPIPAPLPQMPSFVPVRIGSTDMAVSGQDNKEVVQAISRLEDKMENLKQVNVQIDKGGFATHLLNRNHTVNLINDAIVI